MAFICNRKEKCDSCSCYRVDEDGQPACWAASDGKKISEIIVEVWDLNQAEFAKYKDTMRNFNLWVSFIMCYGYSADAIVEYAEIRGIEWDPKDCDPDDETDHYGALKITKQIIEQLKEEINGEANI